MKTKFSEPNTTSKMMGDLPIFKHFESGQLATTSNPLDSFRKGEKPIFNIFKLAALGAVGYLSWVYVLPPLFQALGQIIAVAGSIVLVGFLILMAPVIFKVLRRLTRKLHELAIKHDPFGELYEQKEKMKDNKRKFVLSQGTINKLAVDTKRAAQEAEDHAKELQHKIVAAQDKITKLKKKKEQLEAKPNGKVGPAYTKVYADLITLGSAVQRDMAQKDQQQNFVRKYGIRANTIQKLSNKLILVGAQMDIKVLDFDATIDILKREYDFAQSAREATQTAKNALLSTEGWEVEYAMDVVTTTIAQDIAMTTANINDINNYTTLYDMDDDTLYTKLDALAEDIKTGKDVVPSAKDYNNPDYEMTHEDQLNAGQFGNLF